MDNSILECAIQLSKFVYERTNQFIPEKDIAALMEKFLPRPDDGKGQPEQTPELWAVKYQGEYLPYTWDNEAGARAEVRRTGGYVIPLYRKPVAVIPQAAPQGWQQGAAREIRSGMMSYEYDGGLSIDEIEAIITRHQEGK
jgi:hypothetical protein